MLLVLRSKLWGTRTQQHVSGSGATTQSQQTNAGNCLWYSALTKNVLYLGATIKKLIEGPDEPFILRPIEGEGATEQAGQHTDARATVSFSAKGATLQFRRRSAAVAYQIIPISGDGGTLQEAGWSTAHSEHVDVELEALAAVLAAL